jgi:predicted Zn-dependent protease
MRWHAIRLFMGCLALAAILIGGCSTEAPQDETATIALIKETVSPLNEYYIGRAVTAAILNRYKDYDKPVVNDYVTKIGQVLAFASPQPELYGGYHFRVLDTDEITAFAAPGGFVLVSIGMLKCCKSEDALAAVIAHEIAHIQLSHGLLAIRKSRLTRSFRRNRMVGTMNTFGPTTVSHMRMPQTMQMSSLMDNCIYDISSKMIIDGYSRNAEQEADALAVEIMKQAGYDPAAFISVLSAMKTRFVGDNRGFAKTHPSPDSRIEFVRARIGDTAQPSSNSIRKERFEQALSGISP